MSVTLYVNEWEKQTSQQKKAYVSDKYPDFTQEDIDIYFQDERLYKKDDKGIYEMETVYDNPFPILNYSNSNFQLLLETLDYKFEYSGEFPIEQLPEVSSKIIRVINTNKISHASTESYQEGNFYQGGQSVEAAQRKYKDILNLIQFAIKNNKSVYWG
jgi:hypothetical protein